jgi:hypothetical protein
MLAACSGNSGTAGSQTGASAAPAAAPTNPTDFPLYPDSRIVAVKDFTKKVDESTMKAVGGAFSQGSGTYAGHQAIAETAAAMAQLSAWLTTATQTPPQGYSVPLQSSALAEARANTAAFGIDFAPFVKDENGTKVGFLVIAMDPQTLDRKLGPAIGLLEQFHSMPEMLRGPIDKQVKSRIGITATQALDPASPLSAALAAYEDVKSSNERAIVVMDAVKQH